MISGEIVLRRLVKCLEAKWVSMAFFETNCSIKMNSKGSWASRYRA